METREILLPAAGVGLPAILAVPAHARGLVVFAHGSGSGRHSPRNTFVARQLAARGIATLLPDLLTPDEDRWAENRFDIPLLARRLEAVLDGIEASLASLPLGLFGASTGAAAALRVAASHPEAVAAVVSRGGRPDLAGREVLRRVRAPTLFIVGGDDSLVLALNEDAYALLASTHRHLAVIQGASHLFEEPGALDQVAALAADWFARSFEARREREAVPSGAP